MPVEEQQINITIHKEKLEQWNVYPCPDRRGTGKIDAQRNQGEQQSRQPTGVPHLHGPAGGEHRPGDQESEVGDHHQQNEDDGDENH